jgi:hypothetical protein
VLPEVSVIEGEYLRAPSRHNFVIPTEAERNERSGEPALSEVEGDLLLFFTE